MLPRFGTHHIYIFFSCSFWGKIWSIIVQLTLLEATVTVVDFVVVVIIVVVIVVVVIVVNVVVVALLVVIDHIIFSCGQ